jgi:hypothetical protein
MNPNRLLRQNGLLVQQNNSLNTSLNMTVHRMRSIEHELQEHKTRLATLKVSAHEHTSLMSAEQLQEHKTLVSNATARALSAEKKLEEHKTLVSNATARALSAEQQLQDHKTLVSNATARALSAEKKLEDHKTSNAALAEKQPERLTEKLPVENPPIHITRTRRT